MIKFLQLLDDLPLPYQLTLTITLIYGFISAAVHVATH